MRKFAVIMIILLLAAALAASASAYERTPPGSYLVYRASTVGELRTQISKNPLVRTRYTKHFGASPAALDSYFASNLQLIALKKPLKTQSWYIDRAGKISVHTKLLPRGAMVFATKDGQPLLSWSCGNPLGSKLPKKLVKVSAKPVETKVLANPMETISTAIPTAVPATAAVSILPVEMAPVLATVAAPAISMPPVMSMASGFSMGWMGALGAAGGIAAAIPKGNRSGPPSPPVPEPSSLAILGSGLCMMPGLYRIRRRSQSGPRSTPPQAGI